MVTLLWGVAAWLTVVGALLLWGAWVLEVESFYADSSAILGLALVLAGLAQLYPDGEKWFFCHPEPSAGHRTY